MPPDPQGPPLPASGSIGRPRAGLTPTLGLAALLAAMAVSPLPAPARAGISSEGPRTGVLGMGASDRGSLLVAYYEGFLRDRDLETFRQQVSARYTEGTLVRLIDSESLAARRAGVLALGLLGTMESNAAIARALRDGDPLVRELADNALWAIWFRADTPENNATLEQVRMLIGHDRLAEAVDLATRLIALAPDFAEAYNQRAIAHYFQGHYQQSADDCRRVLERNPYHFGALSGLGKCQLSLEQPREALKTFRRALRLQPFSQGLRQTVASLEAVEDD